MCKTVLQVDSAEGFQNLMRRVKAGKMGLLYQGARDSVLCMGVDVVSGCVCLTHNIVVVGFTYRCDSVRSFGDCRSLSMVFRVQCPVQERSGQTAHSTTAHA